MGTSEATIERSLSGLSCEVHSGGECLCRCPTPEQAEKVAAAWNAAARLPRTADGVPVTIDDEVWYPGHLFRSWPVDYADNMWIVHINPDGKGAEWFGVRPDSCYYSPEAAALAAKEAQEGK